jgi:hypothetical protein
MWDQIKEALAQSTAHFLTRFASLLPGLAALIVALLASIFVAGILAIAVRRLLTSLQLEKWFVRWGFASATEWQSLKNPAVFVSQVVAGLVIFVGFLIGITAFDAEWTSLLARSALAYIPNVLGAVLVLIVGTIVARFLARSVLIGAVNMNFQHARLLSVGVKWLLVVLASAMALDQLKIAPRIVELAFGILFGGIVFTLALAVGLGLKELVTQPLERDAKKATREIEDPLHHL